MFKADSAGIWKNQSLWKWNEKMFCMFQLYDIHPLFGYLPPGESETVAFTFFGHVGVKAEVTALCDVQGGPEYELQLSGEASNMHYNIDKTEIDLGVIVSTSFMTPCDLLEELWYQKKFESSFPNRYSW